MKLHLSIILTLFFLYGCGSAVIKRDFVDKTTVYNFGDRFDFFWERAKDKTFDKRLELWDEYIEGRYRNFYEVAVWNREHNAKWQKQKLIRLKVAFKIYEKYADQISHVYKTINIDIEQAIKKFKAIHPNSKLDVNIFVFPFGYETRVAYVAIGNKYKSKKKTINMAISPDTITHHKKNIEHILIHELFHVHHAETFGLNKTFKLMIQNKYSNLLWFEGLAEYHSHLVSPKRATSGYIHDILNTQKNLKKEVLEMISNKQSLAPCEKRDPRKMTFVSCFDTYLYAHKIIKVLKNKYGMNKLLKTQDSQEIRFLVEEGLNLLGDEKSKMILNHL